MRLFWSFIAIILAIISVSNESELDPCSDFSEYACRGKTKNLLGTMTKTLYKQAKDILIQESKKPTEKAKKFYKSCVDTNKIRRNGPRQFYKKAKEISRLFSLEQKVYTKQLFRSHFINSKTMFPYDSFISISKVIDPVNNTQLFYRISAPKLYLIQNLELKANKIEKLDSIIRETKRLMELSRMLKEPLTVGLIREMFQIEIALLNNFRMPNDELEETLSAEEINQMCPSIGSKTITDIIHETTNGNSRSIFPVFIDSKQSFYKTCKFFERCTNNSSCSFILSNYFKWSAFSTLERFLTILPYPSKVDLMKYKNIKYDRHENGKHIAFRCMVETNHFFPNSMSYLMKTHFSEDIESKRIKTNSLIETIQKFLIRELSESRWLKQLEKIELIMKMKKLRVLLFYPSIVTDELEVTKLYESIDINECDYFTNLLNVIRFVRVKHFQLANSEEALMEYVKAMQVNAMYSANSNMIVIPLGILQHPVYPEIDDSENSKELLFTKLKFLLGHELGHAYDNQGIQFDSNGNYRKTLSVESQTMFSRKADCFVKQYRSYNLSGDLQLSENIADFLGIKSILHAFHNASSAYLLRSFKSYSEFFCDDFSKQDAGKDPHSPPKYRINGPLSTSRKFSKLFKCPRNSEMNADLKCSLF